MTVEFKEPSVNESTLVAGFSEEVQKLAISWGWEYPSHDVLEVAQESLRIKTMKSGEYLVSEGVFTKEEVEQHLKNKPANLKTFEYLARIDPQVSSFVDRHKAAQAGHPFYDIRTLERIDTNEKSVLKELDDYDAVLAKAGSKEGVIILFSSYDNLNNFKSKGRDFTLQASAIYKHICHPRNVKPQFALAHSLAVSTIVRELRVASGSDGAVGGNQSNHWAVSAGKSMLPEEKELSRLIDYCLVNEINDIAFKPDPSGSYEVNVRQFGDLVIPEGFKFIEPALADKMKRLLISKSKANTTHSTRLMTPKDGSLSYSSARGKTGLRASFIPTNHRGDITNSTSISVRLMQQGKSDITISELNLSEQIISDVQDALSVGSGLILIVGPTNSGKSTTIAGAMNEHIKMFGNTRKRLSLEDPIERFLNGVTQFEPFGEEENRFELMLRAFKRHDPDVVWVGEVRDTQTAELSVDTAASGHLVLTSLHANDTVTGVDLLSRQVSATKSFQLIESLSLIISQRLVKTVCPHCSSMGAIEPMEERIFKSYLKRVGEERALPEAIVRPKKGGCVHCRNGYNGMVPINESLPMTREAKNAAHAMIDNQIANHNSLAKHRSLTMIESAMGLVEKGQVELMSILK